MQNCPTPLLAKGSNRPIGISSFNPDTIFSLEPTILEDADSLAIDAVFNGSNPQPSPSRRIQSLEILCATRCSIRLGEIMGHARRTARVMVDSIQDSSMEIIHPSSLYLFAKFFPTHQIESLRREMISYRDLKPVQGSMVPFCYGVFKSAEYDGLVMLLEDVSSLAVPLHLFQGDKSAIQYQNACTALKTIHDFQVIHSDLSHGNVLITADNEVILLDFERARSKSDLGTFRNATNQLRRTFLKFEWKKEYLRRFNHPGL